MLERFGQLFYWTLVPVEHRHYILPMHHVVDRTTRVFFLGFVKPSVNEKDALPCAIIYLLISFKQVDDSQDNCEKIECKNTIFLLSIGGVAEKK